MLSSLLALEMYVVMRDESAADGISKAVVLCLQSGKARGETPHSVYRTCQGGACEDV